MRQQNNKMGGGSFMNFVQYNKNFQKTGKQREHLREVFKPEQYLWRMTTCRLSSETIS